MPRLIAAGAATCVLALILLCTAFDANGAESAVSTQSYSVIRGDNTVGHLDARIDGQSIEIEYDVKDNGRGPTISERIELDDSGLPRRWRITGNTTFGSVVDERFAREDGRSQWQDSVGPGEDRGAAKAIYIGQNASPWAIGLYARAALDQIDRSLPALPGGRIQLTPLDEMEVADGSGTLKLRSYALSGLDYSPDYFLLDENEQLFAVISPGSVLVRKGFESEQARLRERAQALSSQWLENIARQTSHRFEMPLRIRNVRVFDPTSEALGELSDVIVFGDRISAVMAAGGPGVADEAVIDGEGGSLVAGLFEMHGHLSPNAATLNVAAGVTSVRDMGNRNGVLGDLIQRIESGKVIGPRVTRSGFIEGRSPFNSNSGILVSSQQEAIDAVRWYASHGFWQVKLYNSMNPAWSQATAAEAHRLGLRVAGHVPAFSNADAMIAAGYDELTHINQVMLGWVLEPEEDTRTLLRITAMRRLPALDLASAPVQKTIAGIVDGGLAVEPTIAIHEAGLTNRNGQIPRGMVDTIDHLPIAAQRDAKEAWVDLSEPGDDAAYRAGFDKIMDTLRLMRKRGVLLIPGTDLGGSFALHRELELFGQLGYTPAQTLKRASFDMARYLGQEQSLGSIEKGKLADFFLVPGDPTVDIKALKSIRLVLKNGVLYFPPEIHPHFGIRPFATAPQVSMPAAKPPAH